jgi:hypothetical protein
MGKAKSFSLRALLCAAVFIFLAVDLVYAADTYLYWGSNWKTPLKRKTATNGEIYEYYNEIRVPGSKGGGYGRSILEYNPNTTIPGESFIGYKKWDWDTLAASNQVKLEIYEGAYSPASSDVWSDIQPSERRTEYIYDYNTANERWWEVDTKVNLWVERLKTIYGSDGFNVLNRYWRDTAQRLLKELSTSTNIYSTFIYFNAPNPIQKWQYKYEYSYNESDEASVIGGATPGNLNIIYVFDTADTHDNKGDLIPNQGRLIREVHPVDSGLFHKALTYYTYNYHTSPGMEEARHYKRVYKYDAADEAGIIDGTITGTFDTEYELVAENYMVGRKGPLVGDRPTGEMITYRIDGSGVSHNNTYIDHLTSDPDKKDILLVYNWDASWNIIDVKKYYPDGKIEICTPTTAQVNGSDPNPIWPMKEQILPDSGFKKGVNLPWLYGTTTSGDKWSNYGYALGTSAATGEHYGFSRNIASLYNQMDKYKGGYVRIFLFSDFRAGLKLNPDGSVWTDANGDFAFTDFVYEDMQALLDSAKALGIKLMPVLFDFHIANGGGPGDHPELINDAGKRGKLLKLFENFFATFGNDSSIYAWDIMNEPEYASGATTANLQAFVGGFTDMIHAQAPGSQVTVGSRNNTDVALWKGLGLDLYQFHYYDTMGADPLNTPVIDLGLDRPVLVGEVQATDVINKLDLLNNNGYAGGFFWQDGNYTISDPDYASIQRWFEGVDYIYYTSGKLETATYSPAKDSDLYYHYIDEAFDHNGNGTIEGDENNYGRVDFQIRATPDPDLLNATVYIYDYYGGTKLERIKWAYKIGDYSDPSHPVVSNRLMVFYTEYFASGNKKYVVIMNINYTDSPSYWEKTLEYWDVASDSTGKQRIHRQWLFDSDPAKVDDIYYEYDTQERLICLVRDDGTGKGIVYVGDTDTMAFAYEYDASGNLLVTYSYYNNSSNDLFSKDVVGEHYYEYAWDIPAAGKLTMTMYEDNTKAVLLGTYIYYYTDKNDFSTWTLADNIYYGTDDQLWHRIGNFINIGSESKPQIDDAYSGFDAPTGTLTGFTYHAGFEYHSSGKIKVKRIYDNMSASENIRYEKYTYFDASGDALNEKIFYFDKVTYPGLKEIGSADNKWHRSNSFTAKLADGMQHTQYDEIYNDAGLTILEYVATYTYFASGRIETKTRDRADAYDNIRYEYLDEDFDWDGNGTINEDEHYGRLSGIQQSGGKYIKILDYYVGTKNVKKEEEYTSIAQTNWTETRWYYESGKLSKKIASGGEAAKYFDAGQASDTDYKLETYWGPDGKIMRWASVADHDTVNNYKKQWYYDGSTYFEVYNYYASGRVRYKDIYMFQGGQWTWTVAGSYADAGGDVAHGDPWGTWAGWILDRSITGASQYYTMPDKPTRSDTNPLSLMLQNQAGLLNAADPAYYSSLDNQVALDGTLSVNETKSVQMQMAGNYTYSGELATSSISSNDLKPNHNKH